MPEKHELAASQRWIKCSGDRFGFARALLLFSLVAFAPASLAAGLNYETQGFGTKYDQSGFPAGTTNFDKGSTAAGTGAKDKAREGKTTAERAREMGDMGNQIGKDYGNLLPQMSKAQQQDTQSGGSSRLSSLLSQRYLPPQPYRKPFEQLGLRTNKNLYVDGPPIRQRLYQEAKALNERSVQMFADASRAGEAATMLGQLGLESGKRGQRMGVARAPGSSSESIARNKQATSIQSGGRSTQGSVGSAGTQKISGNDITGKSEKGLESGSTADGLLSEVAGMGSGSLENFWPGSTPGSTKSAPVAAHKNSTGTEQEEFAVHEKGSSLKNRLAYLDGMFDTIEAQPGTEVATANNEKSLMEPGLELASNSMQVLDDLGLPDSAPFAPSAEFQGGGSLLEEVSLFERVHQTLKRAERKGRLVRSDQQ